MAVVVYELVAAEPTTRFSPHCWKVLWALAHKQLPFETVPLRFTQVAEVEGGGATVPVIRDGSRVVRDSFDIALYLEQTYPDRPTLFGGPGGAQLARFIERWTILNLHAYLGGALLLDIYNRLAPEDQAYFRRTRESRFGRSLEDVPAGRETRLTDFRASMAPLRKQIEAQPFIGGETPLFADYIVAGALQWARIASPFQILERDDPVHTWFERVLDLHDGLGRSTPAAAA